MAGVKTGLVKQALVRYIRERKLRPGDRLPPQGALRKSLGFGTATITAAIHELKEDQVLAVRDKIGVFVLNPEADGHTGRVIGLTVNALEVSAFRSCLSNLLLIQLAERGWQVRPFFCMNPDLSGRLDLAAFPGLRRTIEQGGIEALISLGDFSDESMRYFQSKQLPTLFVGSLERSGERVSIDMESYMHEALAGLKKLGCRRPAALVSRGLDSLRERFFADLSGFPQPEHPETLFLHGNLVPDGAQAARRLLDVSPEFRPDSVVIFDDTLAGSFTAELYRSGSGYRPRLAILRNLQNPMDFATVEPLIFTVDLNELAKAAAELLWKRFHGDPAPMVRSYVPTCTNTMEVFS